MKMQIEEIKNKLAKEKTELAVLEEKRDKLNQKIKEKTEKISKYESAILENEISELTRNLDESGVSLADLKRAVVNGDFSEIQNRINSRN